MSSKDLTVIHPRPSIVLPQAPKDDLKILVSMTDDKSQWKDFSSEGTGFCFVSMQSRC